VVVVQLHHLPDHLLRLGLEVRVLHLFQTQPPGMVFLPYQDALLIAQIQEDLIVGIVGGADGVGAHMPDQRQIGGHGGKGERAAKLRVILMAAQSLDMQRAAV